MKLLFVPVVFALLLVEGTALKRSHGMAPKPKETDQRVKKLFESMRSGNDQEVEFPRLELSDVPALLDYVDSIGTLTSFPRSPLSSQFEQECSEGMVALWLIEGIRKGGNYPSLNSLCFKVGVEAKDWTKASEENHKAVARAYRTWWESAKSLAPEKAKAIDPLKDTGLAWH